MLRWTTIAARATTLPRWSGTRPPPPVLGDGEEHEWQRPYGQSGPLEVVWPVRRLLPVDGPLDGGFTTPFVIVNKPASLSVHALNFDDAYTHDSVEARFCRGLGYERVIFPHRLDKATSGLLCVVVATDKAKQVVESLSRDWSKVYRVLCHQSPTHRPHAWPVDPEAALAIGADVRAHRFAWGGAALQGGLLDERGALKKHAVLRSFIGRRRPHIRPPSDPSAARFSPPTPRQQRAHWSQRLRLADDPLFVPTRNGYFEQLDPYGYLKAHRLFAAQTADQAEQLGGRLAVSEFELDQQWGAGYLLYRVRLHTGRTHQIRIHCAQSGCPIVGDTKYGCLDELPFSKQVEQPLPLHLQAMQLDFTDPFSGQQVQLRLPPPDDWLLPRSYVEQQQQEYHQHQQRQDEQCRANEVYKE